MKQLNETVAYRPEILRLSNPEDLKLLNQLKGNNPNIRVFDQIQSQLIDLVKCQNPTQIITLENTASYLETILNGQKIDEYGVWVYYSWSQSLVHLLDEKEFIEVRTNRNKNNITKEEGIKLAAKTIGIIGLSVGQSIALTIALERTCGSLRLADFDDLELSNLNRIRSGVQNIGLPKVVLAAREIAEIDPFIKVEIFSEGIHKDNIELFYKKNGKIDLLIEVCDNLEMKILSRVKAKKNAIPVVMDTNDRGMIDVERYDLDPNLPIFHGLLNSLINDEEQIVITNENRKDFLFSIIDYNSLSSKMKMSMNEIGRTISSWPQLASSVVLGGAITTHLCRKILLGEHHSSKRYYVDLDQIFAL